MPTLGFNSFFIWNMGCMHASSSPCLLGKLVTMLLLRR
jgi:hypothetical protein